MSTEEGAPSDPRWDDLTPEQKQRLLQLASGGVTRRDVLAGGGALAVGGLLGGGASQALTEPAAASHGAGSVGEPGNPIDSAYVTSIDGDGDNISVAPGFSNVDVTSHFGLLDRVYTSEGDVYDATWSGITAAADDLGAANGGVVYVPIKEYDPASTYTVPAGVRIVGPPVGSRISTAQQSVPVFKPSSNVQPFAMPNPRAGLANLLLDGANTSGADGLTTDDVVNLHYVQVNGFSGSGAAGWRQTNGVDTKSYGVELINNYNNYVKEGGAGDNGNATKHYGMYANGASNVNILGNGGTGVIFHGATIQSSTDLLIDMAGGDQYYMLGCWLEGGTGIRFQSSSANNWIQAVNSHITTSDVTDNGANNTVIVANRNVATGGFVRWGMNSFNLSGSAGDYTGQVAMDSGANTTHGDPDICIWNGTAWRQVGTTNTFT